MRKARPGDPPSGRDLDLSDCDHVFAVGQKSMSSTEQKSTIGRNDEVGLAGRSPRVVRQVYASVLDDRLPEELTVRRQRFVRKVVSDGRR